MCVCWSRACVCAGNMYVHANPALVYCLVSGLGGALGLGHKPPHFPYLRSVSCILQPCITKITFPQT